MSELEWYKEGSDKPMTWKSAKEYCKSLGEGWRLPTINELQNNFDYETGEFKTEGQPSLYWSATVYVPNTDDAWYFVTANGSQGYNTKTYNFSVWPVRTVKGET